MSEIATRIKEAMGDESSYSLAKRLGVSTATVDSWLKGSIPNAKIAADIARALGVSLEWLISGGERKKSILLPVVTRTIVNMDDGNIALIDLLAARKKPTKGRWAFIEDNDVRVAFLDFVDGRVHISATKNDKKPRIVEQSGVSLIGTVLGTISGTEK